MPLSYSIRLPDRTEALVYEDLCSASTYEKFWLPAAAALGLTWVPLFADGIGASEGQLVELLDELRRLKALWSDMEMEDEGGVVEIIKHSSGFSTKSMGCRDYLLDQVSTLTTALEEARTKGARFSIG